MFERLAPRAEPKQPFPLRQGRGGPSFAAHAFKPKDELVRELQTGLTAISSFKHSTSDLSLSHNPIPSAESDALSRCTVNEITNGVGIETLRPKLEFCRTLCASLASELENPRLTITERTVIAAEWDHAVKEGDILALFVDLLRRRDRESVSFSRKIKHYPAQRIRAH